MPPQPLRTAQPRTAQHHLIAPLHHLRLQMPPQPLRTAQPRTAQHHLIAPLHHHLLPRLLLRLHRMLGMAALLGSPMVLQASSQPTPVTRRDDARNALFSRNGGPLYGITDASRSLTSPMSRSNGRIFVYVRIPLVAPD